MSDDVLVRMLAGLEEAPAVRPAFARALRLQLHDELGFGPTAVPRAALPQAPAPRATAGDWLRRVGEALRPKTPRAVALLIVALLLMACAVAGGYIVVRSWLSSTDRGPQYTNDFSLTEVFSEANVFYTDLHLSADGTSIIGLRQPMPGPGETEPDPSQWAVVRIPIADGTATQAETLMPLADLRDRVDWGSDVDKDSGPVRRSPGLGGDALSVASNGDIFVSASIGALSAGPQDYGPGLPASSALVVVHPDGTAQTVLTVRDLAAAGLLGPLTLSNGEAISVAASAPDRLWIRAQIPVEAGPRGSSFWLYEVVDPNGDGDWADRVITKIVLPDSLPVVTPSDYAWFYGAFASEPTLPGHDATHAVLLPMVSHTGEVRLYRLQDLAGDGDLRDPTDVTLLYQGQMGPDAMPPANLPSVTARIVTEHGRVVTDEVVLGGLTRSTRVTRISSGAGTDILRALPAPVSSVLAGADGAIYVATGSLIVEGSWTFHIHRLTPVTGAGTPAPSVPSGAPSAVATPSIRADFHPITPGVERIAYWHSTDLGSEILAVGVDGSGPNTPIAGQSVQGFCRSADGSQLGVLADTEVPNEPFVYVADADGGNMRKLSETANGFRCPFSADRMILVENNEARLVLLNPGTGERRVLMETGGSDYTLSPDMAWLAGVVSVTEGSTVRSAGLVVVNVDSGKRRSVASFDGNLDSWGWSPDSRRVYFTLAGDDIVDFQGTYEVYVVDIEGSAPRKIVGTKGYPPTVFWSADGRTLGVRTKIGDCTDADATGSLLFIDAATGRSREAFHGRTVWAGWSPTEPDTYAYATCNALVLISGGTSREIAKAPSKPVCPECPEAAAGWPVGWWMGWSPKGDYIGLGDEAYLAAVVDVATGEITVVASSAQSSADSPAVFFPFWFR